MTSSKLLIPYFDFEPCEYDLEWNFCNIHHSFISKRNGSYRVLAYDPKKRYTVYYSENAYFYEAVDIFHCNG